jgi:hypothetical protein
MEVKLINLALTYRVHLLSIIHISQVLYTREVEPTITHYVAERVPTGRAAYG